MSNLYQLLEKAEVSSDELELVLNICKDTVDDFKQYKAKFKIGKAIIEQHRLTCDNNDCDAEKRYQEEVKNYKEAQQECELLKSFIDKINPIFE